MWFLAVFYAVWLIQFVAFVAPTVPSNYWIYLLAAIFGPLQGFLNALVIFSRDRKSIRRRAGQNMRKLVARVSAKSKNTGSGEAVDTELARDKDAKQRVEPSVASEEAVQVEIGVGQLDNLGDEKDTPDAAALDGEANTSGEALDKIDDSLLEHAMNSGLLNDDDRELFRAGIEKIQRRNSTFVVE